MKRNGSKGITPVIAIVLLIALTVAMVGIIAVMLNAFTKKTVTAPIAAALNVGDQKNPFNSDGTETGIEISNISGDTLQAADARINFTAELGGRYSTTRQQVKGSITNFDATPTITWEVAPTGETVTVLPVAGGLMAGGTWDLVFKVTNQSNYVDVTRLAIVHAPSSGTVYLAAYMTQPSGTGTTVCVTGTDRSSSSFGDVWFSKETGTVNCPDFTVEVHVNTGTTKLGAFSMNIVWNSAVMTLDITKGTQGVDVGTNTTGWPFTVNNVSADNVRFNAFKAGGITGAADLSIAKLYFHVAAAGTSTLDAETNNLSLKDDAAAEFSVHNSYPGSYTVP